jgi:hypothetical protein
MVVGRLAPWEASQGSFSKWLLQRPHLKGWRQGGAPPLNPAPGQRRWRTRTCRKHGNRRQAKKTVSHSSRERRI